MKYTTKNSWHSNCEKDKPLTLCEYICGKRFKEVVAGVKNLSLKSDSPSIAINLGHYIKAVALLKSSLVVEQGNKTFRKEKKDFMVMYDDAHWQNRVPAVAFRRHRLRALNKTTIWPSTDDLLLLKDYLLSKVKRLCNEYKKPIKCEEWLCLLPPFLLELRYSTRRISEVEEMKITDIQDINNDNDRDAVKWSEQLLAAKYNIHLIMTVI